MRPAQAPGFVVEEPGPAGFALRLALLRERPLRDRAKTRLAALEAARGRLLTLAPLLRWEVRCPLGGSDRHLAGRLAGALADCSPRELAWALEGLLAVELTAPGELEGLLGWYGVWLEELEELEEELIENLKYGPAWAQANVARAEARVSYARIENDLLRRMAEVADEVAQAAPAGRTPGGGCRVWGGKQAARGEAEEEETLKEALRGMPEHIWWYLEPLGLYGPEWERWAEAAGEESSAEDDLEASRREAERWEKPQHARWRPPRPAVAATPTAPPAAAAAPVAAVAPPAPALALPPPPSSPAPRGSRGPGRGPTRLYRRGLLSMRLRMTLLVAAYTVGWLVAAATVTAPVVYLAVIGHWEGAAALGGLMAALAVPYALPNLLETVREVREEVSCRAARFRRRNRGRT